DEVTHGDVKRHYRLNEYMSRNRDNYPTHELGPIAKVLGINRGNRMVSLSARSTKAWGLHDYIEGKEDLQHLRDVEFKQGDMVETLITCENGELISLRLDTTLPTYYSREFMVRGTKGMYEELKNSVFLDGEDHTGNFTNSAEKYYDKYMARIWKEITPEMISWGHGGMDFLEFQAFCDCLRNGKEMPIDVYDAAAWMSIAYLTEQSIAQGGAAVEIPDFTNGAYKKREIKDVIEFEL
ncbi:MAG: gfo/Idh/MocA family oxidoreductase, partial [Clostridia bacterium]|nr:gfo/Idh/MocA family oxidoreductase [Clostridia bacterium]